MSEKAFIIKADSELYKDYFLRKKEMAKFRRLAAHFFTQNGLTGMASDSRRYCLSKRLTADLTEEERSKFNGQLLARQASDGEYQFRLDAPLNKEWVKEVWSKVDTNLLLNGLFWHIRFETEGSRSRWARALWDDNGTLYALVENEGEIGEPEWADRIPLSEYYRIREKNV